MHAYDFHFAKTCTLLFYFLLCASTLVIGKGEGADEYRAMQREISKRMIGPKSLSMCMSGAHCIAGCDCIDRACVNVPKFVASIKSCQKCATTEDACASDKGKCLPSIGFCDVCASAAVKAGLDSCIPSSMGVPTPKSGDDADVIIAIGNGAGESKDVPFGTEEPPFAVPPGASINPEEEGESGSRNVSDGTDSTDSEIAVPDSVGAEIGEDSEDSGSFEQGLPLPSPEEEEGDCVEVSWLRIHGHISGVIHEDFHDANVLCLPLEYNLPCATRGHLLRHEEDGRMESYESLCSADTRLSCVSTRKQVGRLRANYEWSRKASSNGIELTPFSAGNTRISHLIARAAGGIAALGGAEMLDGVSRYIVKFKQLRRTLRTRGAAVVPGSRR